MSEKRQAICMIAQGLTEENQPLQPWRYLYEVARQLSANNFRVQIISDHPNSEGNNNYIGEVLIQRLPSIGNLRWRTNIRLQEAIEEWNPDIIIWHLSLTSLIHQQFNVDRQIPIVGIFTSPIYQFSELMRLKPYKLIRDYRLSAIHIVGSLVPRSLLQKRINGSSQLTSIVVQTKTTRRLLLENGMVKKRIDVIGPGVDSVWRSGRANGTYETREELGYGRSETIVLYFGSSSALRGTWTLIKAFEIAHKSDPSLRLLILSRQLADDYKSEDRSLQEMIAKNRLDRWVKVVSGYLTKQQLVSYVSASDVVALPFELVPSDAPLSILEAQAMGKPVVTTRVACLPEMLSSRPRYLANPGDPHSLADSLKRAVDDIRDLENKIIHSKGDQDRYQVKSWDETGDQWVNLIENLYKPTFGAVDV